MKVCLMSLAIALTAVMNVGLMNVSSVHAAEVQPRAILCSCGGTFYGTGITYTSWSRDGVTRKCSHGYPWGEDHRLSRSKISSYKCTNCGLGYEEKTTEYYWECHGYK